MSELPEDNADQALNAAITQLSIALDWYSELASKETVAKAQAVLKALNKDIAGRLQEQEKESTAVPLL